MMLSTFSDKMGIISNDDLIKLIPTLAILFSAAIYYFGVRWGETHVEDYNVASHYFAGILFAINFMLKPYVIIRFIEFIFEIIIGGYTFHLSVFKFDLFLYFISFLFILFEYIILRFIRSNLKKLEETRTSLDKFNEFDCTKIEAWKWLLLEFALIW